MSPPAPITLFLCGDVMTGRGVDQALPHPVDPQLYEPYVGSALDYLGLAERANGPVERPADLAYVWGDALEAWRRKDPDLRIVNLETSITRSEDHVPKGINYRMSPENAACLSAAGLDCCVLANNHVLDWGPAGLFDTLETLRRLGIGSAGAGLTLAEAAAPAILPARRGGRVLVFAFATPDSGVPPSWAAGPARPGVNLVGPSDRAARSIAADIARVRRAGDIVVASIHWGPNWGYDISEDQQRFARALIDHAGVSIVHGHSSHHPMGMEVHRNRLILYGCGDFLNDYEGIGGHEEFRPDLSLMYFPTIDAGSGELMALDLVPLQIRRLRLIRASGDDAEWLRAVLTARSPGGVRLERRGDDLRLVLPARGEPPPNQPGAAAN